MRKTSLLLMFFYLYTASTLIQYYEVYKGQIMLLKFIVSTKPSVQVLVVSKFQCMLV